MYNITNFKTIRSKMSVSGNIIHSILAYKLMGPVSYFLLPKEWKKRAKQQIRKKNWARNVSKPLKNDFFRRDFSTFK